MAYLFRALSGTLCSNVGVGHYSLLLEAITKISPWFGGVACSLTVDGLINYLREDGNAKSAAVEVEKW